MNIEETSDLGCSNVSHGLCGCFSESRHSQKWFSPYILFSQEHWREDQKAWMSGTPSPPRSVGVNMRDLGYLCLFPAMKEVIRLSSWRINDLGGVGRAIAMWVNFERTFDFTMLAFPCGVDLLRFQATISAVALLRGVVQLISSWSRLPVR